MLAPGVTWHDDWFALEPLSPGVTAIGEPRFHQINWNYLIEGEARALLFDTGPGVRDIAPLVRHLTAKPLTVLPSHLHFDHTGNLHRFADVAMPDLPELRACEQDGWFHASDDLFLGFREGMVWKPMRVSRWLPIGARIDLGGTTLELLHTPGHSPESVSLLDRASGLLLAADFLYPGRLYAQIPGADLADYLASAERLLATLPPGSRIFGAHGKPDADGNHRAPELTPADLSDLALSLRKLRQSGEQPAAWPVNGRMSLLTWGPAFRAWQSQGKS